MGLSKVTAPDESGNWWEIVTKYSIEKATLIKNERYFIQTKGTSLVVAPMVNNLGLLGIGKVADNIIKGDYAPPAVIEVEVVNIFEHLKCPPYMQIEQQSKPINSKEYRLGWKKVKERISSIASGLHVGH